MTAIDAGSPILARARAWERAAVERSQAASLGLAPAGRLDEVRAELRA